MPGLNAAAGQPDGEAARVVVAAVVGGGERALRVGRAAEFAAPDDERVVEQAALFEVDDERGGGLVGFGALAADAGGQAAVLVPALVVELDEAHAALGQPAGQQAVGGEGAGLAGYRRRRARTWSPARPTRFGDVGHAGLHAERHFVLGDARFDLGVELLLELVAVRAR